MQNVFKCLKWRGYMALDLMAPHFIIFIHICITVHVFPSNSQTASKSNKQIALKVTPRLVNRLNSICYFQFSSKTSLTALSTIKFIQECQVYRQKHISMPQLVTVYSSTQINKSVKCYRNSISITGHWLIILFITLSSRAILMSLCSLYANDDIILSMLQLLLANAIYVAAKMSLVGLFNWFHLLLR